jgi:hypothetical protein
MERTLYADQLCGPCVTDIKSVAGGDVVMDTGYVLQAGHGHEHTARYANSDRHLTVLGSSSVHLRGIYVRGADGREYVLAANFGETAEAMPIPYAGEWKDVATGESLLRPGPSGGALLELAPGDARLIRMG